MIGKRCLIAFALVVAAGWAVAEDYGIPKGPCGTKPPAQQQNRKGGEGAPPLPLPATPLRRTERKRPPAPPPLIVKIAYGTIKEVMIEGKPVKYWDWDKDPGDVQILLNLAGRALDINYTMKKGPLSAFPPDPAQYAIFHYCGSEDFTLSEADVTRLREFVRAGGTIWGDTVYGNPDFFQAFVREMGKVLPDRQFQQLPPDHPLLGSFYQMDRVAYTRQPPDAPNGEPIFYGMDLGCRTAILLSRYGLCCGWDGHIREGAFNVAPPDARQLGINMIAYTLASHDVGMNQAIQKVYYEEKDSPRGEFVIAQARVGQNWDCQANGIANLLKAVATKTSAEIKFERKVVDLAGTDLMANPFLYIIGHEDFVLSDAEVQGLRAYLAGGGFVLGSACCGARGFDAAFRREIARVLPGKTLQPLSADHPVYNIMYPIETVAYSPYAQKVQPQLPAHPLEGIGIGGVTCVVYSPFGLGGWRGFDHPFGRDIAGDDAMRLGVNIVMYSLTH